MDCAQGLGNYILQITVIMKGLFQSDIPFPRLFPEVRTWESLTSKQPYIVIIYLKKSW